MRRPALIGAFAVLMGLAGCGSTELSDKQLRARATRVCATANRQTGRIQTPAQPIGGAAFLSRGIAVLEPEYRQLKALRPPGDLSQVYGISMTAFSHKLTAMKTAVHHLRHSGEPVIAIKTLQQQLGPVESSENGAWQALEVPACLNR